MATTLLEALEPVGLTDVDVFNAVDKAQLAAQSEPPAVPPPLHPPGLAGAPSGPDSSIAAYYSLVFPQMTYYLQTLTVTIGRRTLDTDGAEGADQVDVDLGAVKSVSRRHAQITYDEDEECWVLDVFGRNGAWVDKNWYTAGSRIMLQSKSHIRISTRSFYFILPPSAKQDETTPDMTSPTSTTRPRSPSVEPASVSPASSLHSAPSPTPPEPEIKKEPEIVQLPKPKQVRKRSHSTPESPSTQTNSPTPVVEAASSRALQTPSASSPAPFASTSTPAKPPISTKPKTIVKIATKTVPAPKQTPAGAPAPSKATPPVRAPAPAVTAPAGSETAPIAFIQHYQPQSHTLSPTSGPSEPLKPSATLSQLCYRAIKALGGRATLQSILGWIMDTYEWYRLHEGEKWESSVRHNLSSNPAFLKSQRTSAEPGKGAFWCIDPAHVAAFEQNETRALQAAAAKAKPKIVSKPPVAAPPKVKKEDAPVMVPAPMIVHRPPIPPPAPKPALFTTRPLTAPKPVLASPFTSLPLSYKAVVAANPAPSPAQRPAAQQPAAPRPAAVIMKKEVKPGSIPAATTTSAPTASTSKTTSTPASSNPATTPAPSVPAAAAPAPPRIPIVVSSLPSSFALPANGQVPLIAIHEGKLFLSPKCFSHLSPDEIEALEKLGAQEALKSLQPQVVKYLKEQMMASGRGRGRGRGRGAPPGRGGPPARGGAPPPRPAGTSAASSSTPTGTGDVDMADALAPERATSQARLRSSSPENSDKPPAKRPRIEPAATEAADP